FANLNGANLNGADFLFATLSFAYLGFANLNGANLSFATLRNAILRNAILRDAILINTDLRDTFIGFAENLSNQQIKYACFWEKAIYTEVDWNEIEEKLITVDEKANQKRIEAIRQDKTSDPETPPDCDKWK
ncbi:pentapeptide repeat-containing protein, partial [Myxosarcina sp. GI1]|uniref:pentapeptide repeat-containing protein n=1 Tax=Myxosarcina sp. GI1 TaxID=1541065 RepID=UPI00155AA9DA